MFWSAVVRILSFRAHQVKICTMNRIKLKFMEVGYIVSNKLIDASNCCQFSNTAFSNTHIDSLR